MPLYHIINLIKEKFLKSSTSSDPIIELRCNEFYLMNSQFEQLGPFPRPRKFEGPYLEGLSLKRVEIIIPESDLKIHAYRKINFVETLKKKIEKQMFDKFLCDIGIRSPNHSRLLFVKKLYSQNFNGPIFRFLVIDRVSTGHILTINWLFLRRFSSSFTLFWL